MNTHTVIEKVLNSSDFVVRTLISDLSDAELLVRPVDNAAHIAWQLGHLILSEYQFMEEIKRGKSPSLPAGFLEAHAKSRKLEDGGFLAKKDYLDVYEKQRRATLELLETLSDTDLDEPAAERVRSYAPTIGDVFLMQGTHPFMHVGQFAVVRRKLGKPVLI